VYDFWIWIFPWANLQLLFSEKKGRENIFELFKRATTTIKNGEFIQEKREASPKGIWKLSVLIMLGRCVSGVGSNDDVSNFPEVNVNLKFFNVLTFFHSNSIQLNRKEKDSRNIFLLLYFQIYTEWANYYLERAKSKRTVTDLSGEFSTTKFSHKFADIFHSTNQPIAAMDYYLRISLKLSPTLKYLIWRRNPKHNNKW
jgi:hypothetical protein